MRIVRKSRYQLNFLPVSFGKGIESFVAIFRHTEPVQPVIHRPDRFFCAHTFQFRKIYKLVNNKFFRAKSSFFGKITKPDFVIVHRLVRLSAPAFVLPAEHKPCFWEERRGRASKRKERRERGRRGGREGGRKEERKRRQEEGEKEGETPDFRFHRRAFRRTELAVKIAVSARTVAGQCNRNLKSTAKPQRKASNSANEAVKA